MSNKKVLREILLSIEDFNSWNPTRQVIFANMGDSLFLYDKRNETPIFEAPNLPQFQRMFNAYWAGFQRGVDSERRK